MFFYQFFQKSLFTENYFLIAVINLATRGPLYTCLVLLYSSFYINILYSSFVINIHPYSSDFDQLFFYMPVSQTTFQPVLPFSHYGYQSIPYGAQHIISLYIDITNLYPTRCLNFSNHLNVLKKTEAQGCFCWMSSSHPLCNAILYQSLS